MFTDDDMIIQAVTGSMQVEGQSLDQYQLVGSHSRPDEPWTDLNPNIVLNYQPFADEVIFALDDTVTAPGLPVDRPWEVGYPQEREALNGQQHALDRDRHGASSDNEDVIDEPPVGDPIGPPITNVRDHHSPPNWPSQARHQGGRHGRLDEATARRVRDVRDKGACWNCRLQRYRVSFCRQILPCELS
jgi:hypothetical protein